ncbi:zinc finger and BTB domain-containing protein 9 isoform X1 [Brachyhypopomus gauderio]|uniref:zinc finger and BTB domain-containing protein 9 isoform X1 n=2 Tax=Brachyhypopomus gauderio TaxID=698409 RepID=UPI0040423129
MDKGLSSGSAPLGPVVQVCFPNLRASVLDNLNRQREEGRLCDLSIQVQGQVFRAHRCVLAASSPYFHDQVLLKNVTTVSLPSVMDPLAFESVLNSAYTGQLSIVRDDIVNYVTVASFLQMWHIVDKCTDILKRSRPLAQVNPGEPSSSRHQSPSSSDCCLTDPEERGQAERCLPPDRKPPAVDHSALPPLATWRRPQQLQQQGRWGRSRLAPPPQHRSDSPLAHRSPSGEGEQPSSPEGLWTTNERANERHRVRARLRGAQESRERGMRGDEEQEEEDERRRGERWMEADEGVGEELEEERVKVELDERGAGDCGSGAPLKEESEREGGGESAEREREQQEGFLSAQSRTDDAQEVPATAPCPLPGPSTRAQWQPAADWSAGPYAQPGGRLLEDHSRMKDGEDDAEDEMDFSRFTEAGFEGETYDEIEEGTGQVSQRPLLPMSPGGGGGGEFVLGPSELTWTSGALSPPSHASSLPLSSSPIPSSSSPPSLAGTPYAGKVHFCHCGKAFTMKSMRDRHVKMQHLNLRPFACPVCAKSFKMKHHLTKHVKTHGGLRPYECALCGKKIVWRDSYLKHQARCQRLASRAATPGPHADGKAAEAGQEEAGFEYSVYLGEGRGQVKVEVGEGQAVGGCMEGLMGRVSGRDRALMEQVLKEEDGGRYT